MRFCRPSQLCKTLTRTLVAGFALACHLQRHQHGMLIAGLPIDPERQARAIRHEVQPGVIKIGSSRSKELFPFLFRPVWGAKDFAAQGLD